MYNSILRDTERLSLPQGRRVGQPGHEIAKNYILSRMSEMELAPFRDNKTLELPFTDGITKFTNLIGVCKGQDSTLPPILVGAHYDSVIDAPCSDDNATAVAVALAVGEASRSLELKRDLVIAVFDSEEPPYFHTNLMGSTRFHQDHCQGFSFATAIIMDLIGHDVELTAPFGAILPGAARELVAVMGYESQPFLATILHEAAENNDALKILPLLNRYMGDMSDHYAFRLGGVPYLFLTCGMGKYYHTRLDDLRWINFDKTHAIAMLVKELVRNIDGQSTAANCRSEEYDTLSFEVGLINNALGPAVPHLLNYCGLGNGINSRNDMDRLINSLIAAIQN